MSEFVTESSDAVAHTLPIQVRAELARAWRQAHGSMHRGHFTDHLYSYAQGVADTLGVDVDVIIEAAQDGSLLVEGVRS